MCYANDNIISIGTIETLRILIYQRLIVKTIYFFLVCNLIRFRLARINWFGGYERCRADYNESVKFNRCINVFHFYYWSLFDQNYSRTKCDTLLRWTTRCWDEPQLYIKFQNYQAIKQIVFTALQQIHLFGVFCGPLHSFHHWASDVRWIDDVINIFYTTPFVHERRAPIASTRWNFWT